MGVLEEKLSRLDQDLAELDKSDDEGSEVRARFAGSEPVDLEAADGQLGTLAEGISIAPPNAHTAETRVPEAADASWDDENTEIEIIDESDFVLLVDEDDLEEFEKIGEDDALKTAPPALPNEDDGEEGDSFFKKLFSGRRTSSPPRSGR